MPAIHLKKDLGQNLLMDSSVRDRIVSAASITPSDLVIEIGPGKGVLTFPLVENALFVLAVEIDSRFCDYLRERLTDVRNIEVRNADFLRLDLKEEVGRLKERFPNAEAVKVVSNLPFYITTPIITRIVENRSLIDFSILTVQREVAERFTADAGSKRYGAITLFLNYYTKVGILFVIPKDAFRPQPEVDGAVISMTPRSGPPVELKDETLFFRVIRGAFQQRRKMLKNSLLSLGFGQNATERALRESDIDAALRPECLSMKDFARLSDSLSEGAREQIR